MASTAEVRAKRLSAEDFAQGMLAALAVTGERTITASQTKLHRAFRQVLSELAKQEDLKVDLRYVDYDPLYSLSGWLDQFLARAQRDLLVSFPNPSYERMEIRVTPEEGQRLLDELGHQDTFKQFASVLVKELRV